MESLFGIFLITVSAASFGAMPIFARMAYDAGSNPITVLFLRFSLAALFMIIIMAARGVALPRGRNLLVLLLMGGLGYVGQSFCYFTALTMVSAGLVALLLYLYPAFVTILSALLLKAPVTGLKVTALGLSMAGTFFTVGLDGGGRLPGILLGITAPVIYSVYIVVGSKVIPKSGTLPSSTVVMIAAAAVFGGLVAARGPAFPHTWVGWTGVACIVFVSTVLGIVTFFGGLKLIDPSNASIISTFEPVVTVGLAYMILGESITPAKLIGGAMILGAVILLARPKKEDNPKGSRRAAKGEHADTKIGLT